MHEMKLMIREIHEYLLNNVTDDVIVFFGSLGDDITPERLNQFIYNQHHYQKGCY